MIALCVDPGLASIGLAALVFERGRRARVIEAKTVRTSGAFPDRLREISREAWRMVPQNRVPILHESLTHLPDKGATAKVWSGLSAVICAHSGTVLSLDPQAIKYRLCASRSASKARVAAVVADLVDGWDPGVDNHASDAAAAGLAIMQDPAAWRALGA